MKCVRIVGQGVPVRVTDEVARRVVEQEHDGEYCPKSFFKDWYARNTAVTRESATDYTGKRLLQSR